MKAVNPKKANRVHKAGEVRLIDKIIYPIAFISPIMAIPQIYNIWVLKEFEGVSLITWTAYFIVSCFWLYYGYVHKNKPILLTYICFIFLEGSIVLGLLLFS